MVLLDHLSPVRSQKKKGARMESEQFQEYKSLLNEITKGMEHVKQLKASSSTNQETVLERMLSSYEEALSILNGSGSEDQCKSVVSSASDAPTSSASSVWKATQAEAGELSTGLPKNRKLFSRFTERVSVTLPVPDDGYIWRKYGQKHILGSKYPRKCVNADTTTDVHIVITGVVQPQSKCRGQMMIQMRMRSHT